MRTRIYLTAVLLLSIILLLATGESRADGLMVHGKSQHFADEGLNENNIGLAYVKELDLNKEIRGGAYLNSFDKVSPYISVLIHTGYDKLVSLGLQGGFVGGYKGYGGIDREAMPFIVPTISVGSKAVRGEVIYSPIQKAMMLSIRVGY